MASLLVVEDEPHIASGLAFNLQAEGHDVDVVDTGELAVARLEEGHDRYDCVILDVMLPGMDGFSVAQSARTRGWMTPILMLTARGRAEDVLRGFEAGADDYLPKPFELAILLARIGALIRRHDWHRRTSAVRRGSEAEARLDSSETFVFGDKTVDFDANLLRYLVRHEGRAVSRKKMLEDVWNVREDTDTRAIDHFIARLRKYIESEPAKPRHLLTIRGVGYKFVGTPPSRP
jgi:DNA-binding response OmpR family regulator